MSTLLINFYEKKAVWIEGNSYKQGYTPIVEVKAILDLSDAGKKYTKCENIALKRHKNLGFHILNNTIARGFGALRQQSKKLGFDLALTEYKFVIDKYQKVILNKFIKEGYIKDQNIDYLAELINKKAYSIYGKSFRKYIVQQLTQLHMETKAKEYEKHFEKHFDNNGHELYTAKDFKLGDTSVLADMVINGGLAVCKNCNEYEAGLDNPCKAKAKIIIITTPTGNDSLFKRFYNDKLSDLEIYS